jgi:hypothetical protein
MKTITPPVTLGGMNEYKERMNALLTLDVRRTLPLRIALGLGRG